MTIDRHKPDKHPFIVLIVCLFALFTPFLSELKADETQETKEKELKQKQIVEEITITGNAPVSQPVSTVTLLPKSLIEATQSKNLGDILSLSPGVTVSEGQKAESSINLRGMSSKRITLMVDGVPIYEPYFNSFDLKSFGTANVESIKIIKGANSVLYGANTLGGVIDLVTERPSQPFLKLKGDIAQSNTFYLGGSTGFGLDKWAFLANFSWDQSDGFKYTDGGEHVMRSLSQYDRKNYSGKITFHPNDESELMAEVMVTDSDYGIPPAIHPDLKPRYWLFDDWKRIQANLGYSSSFLGDGLLKARAFYVYHNNVLQDFSSPELTAMRWESTYKNDSFGANLTGEKSLGLKNTLKFGLHAIHSEINQQGNVGDPWETFNRTVFSFGLEDHLMIAKKVKLVLGASLDHLKMNSGATQTRLNPILGLRYAHNDYLETHLSLAMKSRFPSMKSLYSSKGGNPDLRDELGRSIELGVSYSKDIDIQGAFFYTRYDDLIQTYRGLEGYKTEQNIGRARIMGFELSLAKSWNIVALQVSYTFLDGQDIDSRLKLDTTPQHQLDLMLGLGDFKVFKLTTWVSAVTESSSLLGSSPPFSQLRIEGHALVNAILSKRIGPVTLALKGENLSDAYYETEPGFPLKGRKISLGVDCEIKKY